MNKQNIYNIFSPPQFTENYVSEVEKNAHPVNLGENESALRCYVENEVNMILSISSPHTEFLTAGEKLEERRCARNRLFTMFALI